MLSSSAWSFLNDEKIYSSWLWWISFRRKFMNRSLWISKTEIVPSRVYWVIKSVWGDQTELSEIISRLIRLNIYSSGWLALSIFIVCLIVGKCWGKQKIVEYSNRHLLLVEDLKPLKFYGAFIEVFLEPSWNEAFTNWVMILMFKTN